MGYSASRSSNPSKSTLKTAFGSNAVVHILTHGGKGVLVCSDGDLTANAVNQAKTETYGLYGTYYGSNSVRVYGGSTKTN